MTIIRCAAFAMVCLLGAASSAESQWRVTSADGNTWLNLGVLAQPQMEVLTTPGGDAAKDFLVRRMRLLFGGKVTDKVTFFIETDAPNIGKANAVGAKSTENVFMQDAVLTYAVTSSINIDGGMMIVPVSRHSTQSAANLLGVDYAPYAFFHSTATSSRVGRDYGVQARGYVADRHVEFRAGIFSGTRGAGATAPFRYTVRAVYYVLEPETGIFYQGASLGARKIVSLGASIDHQDDYTAGSVDAYVDHPIAGGNQAVTAQVNYTRYDGGKTFAALPKQDLYFVEAGFYDKASKLGPFVQWTSRQVAAAGQADESKFTGGLAYWANGHRFNLKLGIGRLTRTGADARTQIVLQGQVFMF